MREQRIENREEIKKLKNWIAKILGSDLDLEDFNNYLLFYSIDGLISKAKHLENIKTNWNENIKPKKIKILKNEIEFLEREIALSNQTLEEEQQKIKNYNLKFINVDDQQQILIYANLKNWIKLSYMNLDKLYKRLKERSDDLIKLETENDFFILTKTGEIINKEQLENYYELIRKEILGALEINISIERLKKIVLQNKLEEVDPDEDF